MTTIDPAYLLAQLKATTDTDAAAGLAAALRKAR